MLTIRLPKEVEKRLEDLAKRTGRTKSFLAREAILTHLEDMEDIYLAEVAHEEYVRSGKKSISLEEVVKNLGLEDQING